MGIKLGNLDISAFKVGSSDCKVYLGDTLLYPTVPSYKLVAQYSDTTEYIVECDGGTVLTQSMVEGHTTPKSAMTSADISGCGMPTFKVGNNSFCGATNLNSVTLNEGITEIGAQAFREATNLRSITFPSTLTAIGGAAFRLSGLREVSGIPSGVTYLGSGTFSDCTSLTAATIPASVTGGSINIFLRDTALKEVHFQGTTPPSFGENTFSGCTNLEKIYIPSCDNYAAYAASSVFSAYTDLIYAENDTSCSPYKSELSYLQKDASHLGEVDLGLPITSNFKVEIKFRYISSGGSQFFGETPQKTSDTDDFRFFWANSQVHFDFNDKRISGSRTTYLSTGDTTSADQVFEFGNYYFNNKTKDKHVSASYTLGASGRNNFCAFRQTGRDYGKIYYIKIYNGSTLVGDFIPVISNNNKYTFYNKITNTICTVIGTLTGA